MEKNVVIAILAIAVILEGGLLLKNMHSVQPRSNQSAQRTNLSPARPNAKGKGGAPIIMNKGMNLKSAPLFKFAYQIAPGNLSTSAKQALVGWNITSQNQSDGSIVVTLTPKDSEDQNQQYTIKSGQALYFIEQTPVDDKANQDKDLNYRDDYGIIVDQSGVIQ